jgi:diadenosine tetraphosphate (Ap4A) HIT family hydrolase
MTTSSLLHTTVADGVHMSLTASSRPFLRGQLQFTLSEPVSSLSETAFVATYLNIKHIISRIDDGTRYATGTDGGNVIYLYPLQKRGTPWKALNWEELSYVETYPGYLHTKSGPQQDGPRLDSIQNDITRVSGWLRPSHEFPDPDDTNLFARLVRGDIPQWRVLEDSEYIAFLTPFPNTPGLTVLIPRKHLSSDILSLNDADAIPLFRTAFRVSRILATALQVERVGVFMEGFEIDYAHVKLVPVLAETSIDPEDNVGPFYDTYKGYLSTQPGPLREDVEQVRTGLKLQDWAGSK